MNKKSAEKLKFVIADIAKNYLDTQSFATVFHARLESINPLKFIRDDDIEIYENYLVVPKYRKFTAEEIGHRFVFISNQEEQVFYYLYEASDPQGSNGIDYNWSGRINSCKLIGTCPHGEVVVTEGDLYEVKHDKGIKK